MRYSAVSSLPVTGLETIARLSLKKRFSIKSTRFMILVYIKLFDRVFFTKTGLSQFDGSA